LRPFLSLGPTPLANAFLQAPSEFAAEPFFPLDVYYCDVCSLVQLLDVIDPEVLFRNYIYVTGTSQTIASHNAAYAREIVDLLQLGPDNLVVEIASNDGSLLKCFQQHGVRTLGIEPATNIASLASTQGIETVNEFFDETVASEIRRRYGPASAVVANNVLAHVDQTGSFLRACKRLVAPQGLVMIEVPYLRDLLDRLEYDTVYHEHLCYFSLITLMRLCDAAVLSITRVDHVPVHGGSLRIYAAPREQVGQHAARVLKFAQEERQVGLAQFERYQRFAADVEQNRAALTELLGCLKNRGKTIAAYGAPAKGNTLLNYCGLGTRLIEYVVDKNPLKVGLYTPGMHIPVLPVATLLERQPDYVLILAWNFAEEIMLQQQAYYERGGRYIIPIPEPRVI
jgi:hypothetical protein